MAEHDSSGEKPHKIPNSVVQVTPIVDEEIEISQDSILELMDFEEDLVAVGE